MRNPCKNRVNILNIKECNLSVFLLGIVWNPCVLRRVSFFGWEAIWVRILTMDQLEKRG